MIMIQLLLIMGYLLDAAQPSSKWILELGDNFIDVRKDGGYWLVKFYTPWCGQCKRLDPIWAHVVQALKNTHIRVGKVDCTVFPNVAKTFEITTFPTVKFLRNTLQNTPIWDTLYRKKLMSNDITSVASSSSLKVYTVLNNSSYLKENLPMYVVRIITQTRICKKKILKFTFGGVAYLINTAEIHIQMPLYQPYRTVWLNDMHWLISILNTGSPRLLSKIASFIMNSLKVRAFIIDKIRADEDFTFEGEKNAEEIINFAVRLSGPPVQQVTRPESLSNLKNMNQLFFMYVGERDGLLWDTFYDVASKYQAHAFYYSASEEIASKHVDIHTLPAVFVHKENSHYFYSVGEGNNQIQAEHINFSMHKWINEERFETFPKITEANVNEILRTEKYIVLVVVEENKLLQIPKEMLEFRNKVEALARKKRDIYHSKFQFGWTNSPELANNIAMQIVSLPYLIVLNSTTLHHHVPEDEPTEMTADAIELFLDSIIRQTAPVYGGNNLAVRIYRTYFKTRTTLAGRWQGNPVLTTVLLGLPFGFLSFILYSCCCANILDADEDEEEEIPHEKKD